MKVKFFVLLNLVFLVIAVPITANPNEKAEILDVVEAFCRLDFEGSRLSSRTWNEILPYVTWEEEPGWDMALAIKGYHIGEVSVSAKQAMVTVKYDIEKSQPHSLQPAELKKFEIVKFKLIKTNGRWLIDSGVPYPRVSSDLLLKRKAKMLEEYYQKSFEKPNATEYRKLFFVAFPNSFADLESIYGYGQPLHERHYDHIMKLFNNLKCIDEREYYTKIINISIGGHWNADAVGIFQDGVQARVLEKPKLAFEILSKRSDEEIKSFFFFFFHGIHPPYRKIPHELGGMLQYYPRVYSLMEEGFKEALSKSDH